MAVVQISDVIVPSVFSPYVQEITEEKAAIIQAGVAARDAELDAKLAGGGLTFHVPSWKDLDNEDENTSTDDPTDLSSASKTGTAEEIAVRVNRNKSWSTMDMTQALAGADPALSIASRVGYYWTRRMQAAFVAVMKGIFANNAVATDAYHVQNDMTNDVSGSSYSAGVTDFTAKAYIDAILTMGDSMEQLGLMMVHSTVYGKIRKNDLIDFIPDSEGKATIATFQGTRIVMDDGVPFDSVTGKFETWLFGPNVMRLGVGSPKVPTEVIRVPAAGNGGGMETMHNRIEWSLHPVGHAYLGTSPSGGPSNAATTNNFAAAGSWRRVYPERKQIKIARLITREF